MSQGSGSGAFLKVGGWYWLPIVSVVALDQSTKAWAARVLGSGQRIALLGDYLGLVYVRNVGAAFSLFTQPSAVSWRWYFLCGVAILTFCVLTVIAHRERPARARVLVPFGLIAGGALGNLIDRVSVGTVADFIQFSVRSFHFPIFNAADSAIVIGVACILWQTLFAQPHEARPPA